MLFKVNGTDESFVVFTTRADTLFGATYCVLSPEHKLVSQITSKEQKEEVEAYVKIAASKSELERTELNKEKTGVWTGAYAINPVNNKLIPIWISDYVLAFQNEDANKVIEMEPLRDVVSKLKGELKQRHIKRLQKGKCTIELGFVHSEIITSYKRVADHCSNVAVCVAEVDADEYETHSYVEDLKHDNEQYKKNYKSLREKYMLP